MEGIRLAFLMLFHPTDAYTEIKRRGKDLSIWPSAVILTLVLAERYIYVWFVHTPLADIKIRDTNFMLEVARILLPVLTVVVSIYAVTSILYGETQLKTIFITVSYCFLPYIVMTPLLLAVSQVMGLTEITFYAALQTLMWIWIVLLVFFSVMLQNDFTLKKTIGVALLTVIGVVLIWAVAIMVIALAVQVVTWFQEVITEYRVFNT